MKMTQKNTGAAGTVSVAASARLHLGFLDLKGGLQRRYGSIGVGITGFSTVVNASHSDRMDIHGADDDYIARISQTVLDYFRINSGVRVEVEEHIPRHQGLGSGTQMALALGAAITGLYGINASVEELASATGRGLRSGVGLGVFKQGGFILDSGKTEGNRPPTLIFRHDFPEEWQFVLVMDERTKGVSGTEELEAFNSLPDMSRAASAEICQQVLMEMLPSIIENDCRQFGASVSRIQANIGEYFSTAQGGLFASDNVRRTLECLLENKATGIGQTSWGPTGFAVFPDKESAKQAVDILAGRDTRVKIRLAGAENRGARISSLETADRREGAGLKTVAEPSSVKRRELPESV